MKNSKLRMVFQSRSTWAWPYALFMLCLVILPLVLIGVYAFTDADGSFTIQNFVSFFTKSEAINTFIYSLAIALITTIICLLLGYPAAYIMAMADFKTPQVMAMLFILPMWINFLLRTIATVELFRMFGLPLGEGALLFGMVYDFLPFMILSYLQHLAKDGHQFDRGSSRLGRKASSGVYEGDFAIVGARYLLGNCDGVYANGFDFRYRGVADP